MNLLRREHEVNSMLSSHARFLSGAHEGQWDADTGLYYLGARFYDPSLGRFIQEDAVEGSADLPASQNRYIYCQNDPVALIDPTGYSPENTGTPARFNLSNLGNFGGSSSGASSTACILPDTSQYFAKGDGIWWGDNSPGEGSIYCFDASGDYEVEEITMHTISDVVSGNDAGTTYYKMTINGLTVYVVQDENGNLEARSGKDASPAEKGMVDGLNAAFRQMKKEGFDIKPDKTKQFLSSIASFAQQNLGTFASIFRSSDNYWKYFQFMKHATIGKVIADEVKKDLYTGDHDGKRGFDHSIAFWVSYYDEKMGYNSTLRTYEYILDENGQYTDDTVLGLIDQMRVIKAVQYKENPKQLVDLKNKVKNKDGTHHSWDIGLFSVNDFYGPGSWNNPTQYKNFAGLHFGDKTGIWTTNVFANIGAGVGMFYSYQFNEGGKGMKGNFTLGDAIHSIIQYNPNDPLLEKVLDYMNNMNRRFPGSRKP